MGWEPRAGEDKLLAEYWNQQQASLLYREAGIGGKRSPWRESTTRRIDGVLVSPSDIREARNSKQFRRDVRAGPNWNTAELIEVKMGLNEGVLGQALVARWMFEQQHGGAHGITVARNVVLYRHEDPAMRWVVDRLDGVTAVRLKPAGNNQLMRSRQRYHLNGAAVARLVNDRAQAPGQIVTRVPIGGSRSGVSAWANSAETYIRFVRIIDHDRQVITAFEGRDWFLEQATGRELEVVVLRSALSRGAVGLAYAHAMMLGKQYDLPRPRLAIVCERGDAALEAACAALNVDVRFVAKVEAQDEGDEED